MKMSDFDFDDTQYFENDNYKMKILVSKKKNQIADGAKNPSFGNSSSQFNVFVFGLVIFTMFSISVIALVIGAISISTSVRESSIENFSVKKNFIEDQVIIKEEKQKIVDPLNACYVDMDCEPIDGRCTEYSCVDGRCIETLRKNCECWFDGQCPKNERCFMGSKGSKCAPTYSQCVWNEDCPIGTTCDGGYCYDKVKVDPKGKKKRENKEKLFEFF